MIGNRFISPLEVSDMNEYMAAFILGGLLSFTSFMFIHQSRRSVHQIYKPSSEQLAQESSEETSSIRSRSASISESAQFSGAGGNNFGCGDAELNLPDTIEPGTSEIGEINNIPCNKKKLDVKWSSGDGIVLTKNNNRIPEQGPLPLGVFDTVGLVPSISKHKKVDIKANIINRSNTENKCGDCGMTKGNVCIEADRKSENTNCEDINLNFDLPQGPTPSNPQPAGGELCYDVERTDCTVKVSDTTFTKDWPTTISPIELLDNVLSAGIPLDTPVNVSVLRADFSYKAVSNLIDERRGVKNGCCERKTRAIRKNRFNIIFEGTLKTCPVICTEIVTVNSSIVGREIKNVTSRCCIK